MAITPHFSHLVMLLFLGAGFATVSGVLISLYGGLRKAKLALKMGTSLTAVCVGGYVLLLLGTGLASPNKDLSVGGWKYFCEADCHIAYSIASAETAATLGTGTSLNQANGEYVVVRLKTWFDEKTISKFRGNAPLTPNPRHVILADDRLRQFSPAQWKPQTVDDGSTALGRPLRPGESYITTFVFDVPKDARKLRLLITDKDPIASLIIDHENSPFHGKIYLSLGLAAETDVRAHY